MRPVRSMLCALLCAGTLLAEPNPVMPSVLAYLLDTPSLSQPPMSTSAAILFLHHSTGNNIYNGGVESALQSYNSAQGTAYNIEERYFPKSSPYGWNNYPFDYWNIWVAHAGPDAYLEEPTLEMLAPGYDLIVWKHCFPVSAISADTGSPDVASSAKRLENYYLQYAALKAKMLAFPETRFLVWTGAALTEAATNPDSAARARTFFDWVKRVWDEPGDNIFVWDFYELETEGGLYMKDEYAAGTSDSHPNAAFSQLAAPLLAQRMVDVIEGRGDGASLSGE